MREIRPGDASSIPRQLISVGAKLYFTANDGIHGDELWSSDGSSSGTQLVFDIGNGFPFSSYPNQLVPLGNRLYFAANDGTHGEELWSSDGTSTGTQLVCDIRPDADESFLRSLTTAGGRLYFHATDGVSGYELWTSNGTSTGTQLVRDIQPGGDSNPFYLTDVGGRLYFRANDGDFGEELWTSDGTSSGTVLVQDIFPGLPSANPISLFNLGGRLLFGADDGPHGWEPWLLEDLASAEIDVRGNGLTIADEDLTPDPLDGTDFGTATAYDPASYVTRQFRIYNLGDAALNLGPVSLDPTTGPWAVVQQPAATVAPGGVTTFQIRFQPTAAGQFSAEVLISHDAPLANPYNFAIQGFGQACTLIGDANGDGNVGTADYAIWAATFGQTGPGLAADFDGNEDIGAGDYALWAANFGRSCPAPLPPAGAAPLAASRESPSRLWERVQNAVASRLDPAAVDRLFSVAAGRPTIREPHFSRLAT